MIKELSYPFSLSKIKGLRLGQMVSVSGRVSTGRDRLHKYLFEGGKSPVDLKDGAIFHCGPVAMRQEGRWVIRAAGPTTSARHDVYMPDLIERFQIRVIIGKGGMGDATRRACLKHGCVYLQAVGGAAVLLAQSIQRVVGVHFLKEFGDADALWELLVKDLRGIVTIDSRGHSFFERIKVESEKILEKLI